jgi:hypothetical protein
VTCPCESADAWDDWDARYERDTDPDHPTRLVWQGNFCRQCGRNVTSTSVGLLNAERFTTHAHPR